jgi:prevent-host-death family protein
MTTLTEIGAYEAKTHLPEFLRKVRTGSAFRITQRGEPVADLIPYGASERKNAAQAANQMRQFMQNHNPVQGVDIKALIEEGRD